MTKKSRGAFPRAFAIRLRPSILQPLGYTLVLAAARIDSTCLSCDIPSAYLIDVCFGDAFTWKQEGEGDPEAPG